MKFVITDPIYRLELTVTIGVDFNDVEGEMVKQGLPRIDPEDRPNTLTNGQCMFPREWNRIGWLWISERYDHRSPTWAGTIAHEFLHVALEVFRTIGIDEVCGHNEEAVAYYVTFLVRSFGEQYEANRNVKKNRTLRKVSGVKK